MRDLKHLIYFENLLQQAPNENVIFSDNTVLCPKALLNGINQSGFCC